MFTGWGALGTPQLACLATGGSSLSFALFHFPIVFCSPRLRNPTDCLCSAFKDFVPSGVSWKTCSGQILSLRGALQALLNSTVAAYWREEYHLAADMPAGDTEQWRQ